MEQLVQVDVRSAYVDVLSTAEQIKATQLTKQSREATLNIEHEKFRLGKSTSFLVAQAQRDLVASEIATVEAVIAYRKALLDLYRFEGTLLERKGIQTP
jgi:outer membrane protein TolC